MKRLFVFLLFFLAISCAPKSFKAKWLNEKAPENYAARFETSKGNFDVAIERKLSPQAADRFYQLVKYGYFNDGLFYRVNPNFVAQFGSTNDALSKKWEAVGIPDEPVLQGNTRGALSFARGGKESRTTSAFINLGENSRLDTLAYQGVTGFPSFGKITKGMKVLESLYSGYADSTMSSFQLMRTDRSAFLNKFPQLDSIQRVYLLDEWNE